MSYEKVNCPNCGRLFSLPVASENVANYNRPPLVTVRTFAQIRSANVHLEIAQGYCELSISRRSFLDIASTRVSEFLHASGRYRITLDQLSGESRFTDFEVGRDCLERVFRPDSGGDIRWLGRLEQKVRRGESFKAPRDDVIEKLQYLDLVLRTPLCGFARR